MLSGRPGAGTLVASLAFVLACVQGVSCYGSRACWPPASLPGPGLWAFLALSGAALRTILAKSSDGAPPPLLTMMPDVEGHFTKRFPSPACSVLSPSCVPSSPRQAQPPVTEDNKPSLQVEPLLCLRKPKRTELLAEP